MREPSKHRARVCDLICLSILTLTCLMLRVPALDRITLNPDESQYEATAAHLVAADQSAFVLPYTTAGTMVVYKIMALLFGPYSMTEVRILILLIALAGSFLLYRLVEAEGSRLGGLVAGLVFIHYSIPFEGFTANREWFSGLALLGGMLLFGRAMGRQAGPRARLLFLSGLACGVALWFKIQAAPMILAVPAVLLWLGFVERRMRRDVAGIACYAAGGLLASALYCLQFALAGTLKQFLFFLVPGFTDYVIQNEANLKAANSGAFESFAHHFYGSLPFRPLLLLAYALSGLCLAVALRRVFRRSTQASGLIARPVVLLFVVYLLTALVSIGLGHRFFLHYYLFMVVPVAAMIGFGVALFRNGAGQARWFDAVGYGLIGLLLLQRIPALAAFWSRLPDLPWRASAPFLISLAVFVVLAALAVSFPHRLRAIVVSLICIEVAMLVFTIQRLQPPPSLPHHPRGFDHLVQQLEQRTRAGDRLFVWGWVPEIYSLTRMEPASVFTITQYVVNDDVARPAAPRLNRPMADLLMEDLHRRPPRFVVDAWRRSWTMVKPRDPWLYRLELYPDFELKAYLGANYERVGSYDDCDLYVKREPG